MDKPYSQACERNQQPILDVLQNLLPSHASVLEVGSGTGQHGVFIRSNMDDVKWYLTDLKENHNGINAWIAESGIEFEPPMEFDVNVHELGKTFDVVFTANTCHIMDWDTVKNMLVKGAKALNPGGMFILYGPFNVAGEYTSETNKSFDQQLKSEDPNMGLRDVNDIEAVLKEHGLKPIKVYSMPANNFMLVFGADS